MVVSRHNSPGLEDEEEVVQHGILTTNDRPVFFYLYGTNEPESPWAIHEAYRTELEEEITQNGGQVCKAERDADTILVGEAGLDPLRQKYELNRSPYVELPWFVHACIAQGEYKHQPVEKRPMSGRYSGRIRTNFTAEDDRNLCRAIAFLIPDPEAGGRMGPKLYKLMVEKAQYDGLGFEWALRHPAESWRERYKRNRTRFDPVIDEIVKKYPPPADGKGVWPYDRRVNHKSIYARIYQINAQADRQEDGEFDQDAAEGAHVPPPQAVARRSVSPARPRPVQDIVSNWPPQRGSHARHTDIGVHPRASASPVEQRRGRVQSAPNPEARTRMSRENMGEFADSDLDEPDAVAFLGYRPSPEDAGPSGTQRTPTPSPHSSPAEKGAQQPARKEPLPRATRQRSVAQVSQIPMSSQATLVGPVPTQLRGAPVSQQPGRPRADRDEEEEEGPEMRQRAAKRRKIQQIPQPPAVELEPLREGGRGARSAPQKVSEAARPIKVAKAAPSLRKPAQKASSRAETTPEGEDAEEEEEEERSAEEEEEYMQVEYDQEEEEEEEDEEEEEEEEEDDEAAAHAHVAEAPDFEEDDFFAPKPGVMGPTLEDEQEVEELVQEATDASGFASPAPIRPRSPSEVVDSDDQRTIANLRLRRAAGRPPPLGGRSRAGSVASKRQLLITRIALEDDDDESFAGLLDLTGAAPRERRAQSNSAPLVPPAGHFVTPDPRRTLRREGTDASSMSSVPGVPLEGTRASEEKRRVRESQRHEEYVPPPGSRAESAQKMQLRSRTVVRRLR
ncbi:hypothetical protein BN946_scf184940.g50 [Trametes cinnabarina]|uniref:BRCT domain-containing protein n=1 Tax=Pycnoporus cinnabarinus TaxID=5643 RepID=A0A060SHK8_PYCCI|nr:hypothetical protein BN946_scf184940.g50 [Trametes cinnabarina]